MQVSLPALRKKTKGLVEVRGVTVQRPRRKPQPRSGLEGVTSQLEVPNCHSPDRPRGRTKAQRLTHDLRRKREFCIVVGFGNAPLQDRVKLGVKRALGRGVLR